MGSAAGDAIGADDNEKLVSPVSIWELESKRAQGKLTIDADLVINVQRSGFSELPLRLKHSALAGTLPMIHRDPFDRMLIAQAKTEGLTLVTADREIARYDVPVLSAA